MHTKNVAYGKAFEEVVTLDVWVSHGSYICGNVIPTPCQMEYRIFQ